MTFELSIGEEEKQVVDNLESPRTGRRSAADPPATTRCSVWRREGAAAGATTPPAAQSAPSPAAMTSPDEAAGCGRIRRECASQDSLRLACNCATSASSSASSLSLTSACSDIQATNGETDPLSVFSTKLPTALRFVSAAPVTVL